MFLVRYLISPLHHQVTCVPSDQNIIELVLPEMENLRPNVFLMLFAVHGDYFGYGADLARLDNLRLSGNPCLVTDVVWHKVRERDF